MGLPRISIVTPSFNQAAFLEQTIDSVLSQKYANLEYVVIDGGSTDGSVEIIRRHAKYLTFWVSEPDRGQTHAINKGMQWVTGEIRAYLNSDDYYLPGAFATVSDCFQARPELDLVHGRCRVVNAQGTNIGGRCGSITRYDEILDLWEVWWCERNFVQPEVFWTGRIAQKIGPFREDLYFVMDYDYWLRILRAGGRVGKLDREVASFRLQPNQKSTQPERTADELLRVARPFIWERTPLVSPMRRFELKGKWAFDALFRREAARSLESGEARWKRWCRLAALSLRHPAMFASRRFRSRVVGRLEYLWRADPAHANSERLIETAEASIGPKLHSGAEQ